MNSNDHFLQTTPQGWASAYLIKTILSQPYLMMTELPCLRKQSVNKEKNSLLITGITQVSLLTNLSVLFLRTRTPHPMSGKLYLVYKHLSINHNSPRDLLLHSFSLPISFPLGEGTHPYGLNACEVSWKENSLKSEKIFFPFMLSFP